MSHIDDMNTAIERAVRNISNVAAAMRLEEERRAADELAHLRSEVDRLRREKAAVWSLCGGLAATVARYAPSELVLAEYDRLRLDLLGSNEPRYYTAPADVYDPDQELF